ncbi:Multidrug resistance-associated protein 7 [Rhizoclosmatium sp. JEL0117]|nr:Multidrug resistance-associated protein 7 [Rhizoclosmatium sp. JEL0117]
MVGVVTNFLNGSYTGPSAFNNGYTLAFLLFGMQLLSIVSSTTSNSLTNVANIRLGAALTTAMYKKSLNLASKSRLAYSAGTVNTLCVADVANVKGFIDAFNKAWSMPIQVIVSIYLVSTLLKASTAVAAGVFIGIGALAFLFMPKLGAAMGGYMMAQDARTTALREFLYGVKVVKYHTLEEHIESKINAARVNQITSIRLFVKNLVMLLFTMIAQQQLTVPLTLVTYGALGNSMDPATVFVALSLLVGLTAISGSLSGIISELAQAFASYKRIYAFLIAEEANESESPVFLTADTSNEAALILENTSFSWESSLTGSPAQSDNAQPEIVKNEKESEMEMVEVIEEIDTDTFRLSNLNLTIKKGSLVAVVGATGSGKSSLLSAITSGMRKTGGKATVYGSIGYCPQEPWIVSGSVEDNITLLDDTLKGSCNSAIQACALSKDLASLSNGLGTQIGEKGINLSGGQKARLALARAIAKNPDIFVLDDPLSALDAHVGKDQL